MTISTRFLSNAQAWPLYLQFYCAMDLHTCCETQERFHDFREDLVLYITI